MRKIKKRGWMHLGRSRRSGASTSKAVTVAFLGGLVVGALVWSAQMQRSRRELFSQSRFRRLAALGYLSAAPSVETATLLSEYVRWEKDTGLRRRGERALRLMKDYLE